MIFRYRIIITALSLCHLLLVPGIVTSQTLPPAQAVSTPLPASPSTLTEEEVTIHASQQEYDKGVYKLRGQAEIHYRNYVLYADEITYNSATGDTEVEGHVVLDGGPYDEHVEASHGIYNVRTQVGTLYDVIGTAGFRLRRSGYILTTSDPFAFTGKVVEKHGPDHYLVRQGTVTTCELPRPKWQFEASRISVDVDGTAKIYNSSFRLGRVPVFYFPFVTHPIQKQERQSGFLIPSIGNSSRKGKIIGESVYLALNRSMDLTLGAEYYSKRGWSQRGEFRARPSDTSYVDLSYFGVLDRGIGDPHQDQGGEDAHFTAEGLFGPNFRGVANVDYLSSFVFRIAFTEVYSQAVNSEVKSQIFLSNTTNGFHYNLLTERYQNYEVCNPDNPQQAGQCTTLTQTELIRILHTPSFFLSGEERQIRKTPFYWSFQTSAEGLQRRDLRIKAISDQDHSPILGFATAPLVGRLDLAPTLSMPLQWKGWSARPELTLRDTLYTQTQVNKVLPDTNHTRVSSAEDNLLNRKALEMSVEVRPPALSKVFDHPWLGRKWKHVIEPRMRYDYVTGIDNFDSVLRFDSTDILSNTNNVEYSVVNRVYAKRVRQEDEQKDCEQQSMESLTIGGAPPSSALPWESSGTSAVPPCAAGPREVLTWEIGQKYYFDPTFGHALVLGQRNVFTSTADFTGIGFLADMRRFSPIISRLRVETSPRTNTEWDLDYDFKTGRINASTALVNYHYGLYTVGGGDAFLRVNDLTQGQVLPGQRDFHQFRFLFGYGQPQKRGFSGASSFGFDHNQGFLQYSTAQLTYNWDCCGVSVEYRRFALGLVRNENQFRFAFSLANVGAFGNLKRHERLY